MAKGIKFFSKLSSAVANATFFIKNADFDEIISRVVLKNTDDPNSGPQIDNLQRYVNELGDTTGTFEADPNAKDYATNNFIADDDNQKECIEKFDVQMKTNADNIQINRDDIDSNDIELADHELRLTQAETDIQAIEDSVGQPNGICPLDGDSEVPIGNLPQEAFDGLKPVGPWDADTNTPDLTALTPGVDVNPGDYYIVSVAGSTNLGGITTWGVNDWAIYTSAGWVRNISSEVQSVNGKKGAVVLDKTDIGLGNVTDDAQLKRAAADFDTFTEKAEPVDDDIVLIEDSEDSLNKKKAKLSNLLGGGGGGSFLWELNEDFSPIESVLNGMSLFDFDKESNMAISALVIVPENYKPGDQINLKNAIFFSSGAADNVLFKCETYLYKLGEDATSPTNAHISTNTEKTLTTANEFIGVGDMDLCDVNGEINSVAVAPFDILKVKLYRDNDNETASSTEDARLLKFSSSVAFKP